MQKILSIQLHRNCTSGLKVLESGWCGQDEKDRVPGRMGIQKIVHNCCFPSSEHLSKEQGHDLEASGVFPVWGEKNYSWEQRPRLDGSRHREMQRVWWGEPDIRLAFSGVIYWTLH